MYDKMAKVAHVLAPMVRYTKDSETGGTVSQGETKYVCVRNTDFAEGSRNPLPKEESGSPTTTGGSPVPTGGAMKGSAGLPSLTAALLMGAFLLLN